MRAGRGQVTIGSMIATSCRAVAVIHEPDAQMYLRLTGTLGPLLTERGFSVEPFSFLAATAESSDGDATPPSLADAALVVVTGSDDAAYDDTLPWLAAEMQYLREADAAGVPILGLCFGGQILSRVLGGQVARAPRAEIGWYAVESDDAGLIESGPWLEFHYDHFTAPASATTIARTANAVQAFTQGPHLGVQFHPEISPDLFEAWLVCERRRGGGDSIESQYDRLRPQVVAFADEARQRCGRLLDRFLDHAAVPTAGLRAS